MAAAVDQQLLLLHGFCTYLHFYTRLHHCSKFFCGDMDRAGKDEGVRHFSKLIAEKIKQSH
jgi:hypothetical protein